MTDTIYVFETLRAAGETYVFDNDGGNDWVFLTGTYPAIPTQTGPSITMGVQGQFMNMTSIWVYDSPTLSYNINFVGGIENIRGSASDDYIAGDAVANTLVGDAFDVEGGRDWLRGQGGNDRLLGVGGSDVLWGGDGDDQIYGEDVPFSQEQSNFSFGDDTLRGDNGNDTLYGGYGTNSIDGGAGYDYADYSGFYSDSGYVTYAMNANMDTGLVVVTATDQYTGDIYAVAHDTLTGIEYLIGSLGNDTITAKDDISLPIDTYGTIAGGAGDDSLFGGRFLDLIYGNDGNDWMSDGGISIPVGGGVDVLAGGAGDDIAYVQTASTVVLEFAGQGNNDLVIASVNYTLGANVERLTLLNIAGVLSGTGNAGGNAIFGNTFGNTLTGLGGADGLYGYDGADTLRGGTEADNLYGGTGNDALFGGTEGDWLQGDAGADILDGGDGVDTLTGGNDNDILYGRTGDDTLFGGGGDDRLSGGTGRERMTGGTGADTFFFATAVEAGLATTRDVITDFTSGQDRLNLAKIAPGQTFIGTAGFSHTAGEIRYDALRGTLSGDLNGDRTADWQIFLQGAPTLTGTDLIL